MLNLRTVQNQTNPANAVQSGRGSTVETPGNYSGQRRLPFQAAPSGGPCQYWRPTGAMSMNIFRLCGDMSHVFSIIVLLLRLRVAKNASGELRRRIRRFVLCLRFMCLCVCPCRRLSKDWPTAPHGGDEMCISRWRRGIGVGIVLPCGGREAMPQSSS